MLTQLYTSLNKELSKMVYATSDSYCDIVNVYSTDTLVYDDGSMGTIIEFKGFTTSTDNDLMLNFYAQLNLVLSELFLKKGYTMLVRFSRNNQDYESVYNITEKKKRTSRRLGFDLDDLLDEQADQYLGYVFKESVYVTLITSPQTLEKLDRDLEVQEQHFANEPEDGIKLFRGRSAVYGRHQAYVQKVMSVFNGASFPVEAKILNTVEMLRVIKEQITRTEQDNWIPHLLDHQYQAVNMPNFGASIKEPLTSTENDISHFTAPSIASQLLGEGFMDTNLPSLPPSAIKIGNYLQIAMEMRSPPKTILPFTEMFAELNRIEALDEYGEPDFIPYSIQFCIRSGEKQAMKEMLGSFLGFANSTNKYVHSVVKELNDRASNEPIVGMSFTVTTWAKDVRDENGVARGAEALKERYARLSSVVQSWGGVDIKNIFSDRIKAWRGGISGLSNNFTQEFGSTILMGALSQCPFNRPLSPFGNNGSVMFRSADGKLLPFELFSPLTNDHQIIVTGMPGSGKSVFLSRLLLEIVCNPKNVDYPKVLYIDVGNSVKGTFDTLKNALPPEQQSRVTQKILRNKKESAINIFDFKMGLKRPLGSESEMAVNFLITLMQDDTGHLTDGISYAIKKIYEDTIEFYTAEWNTHNYKQFSVAHNEELNELLLETELFPQIPTVIKMVDGVEKRVIDGSRPEVQNLKYIGISEEAHRLAKVEHSPTRKAKLDRISVLAWRYAMPTMAEFATIAQNEKYTQLYNRGTDTNDKLIDVVRNKLTDIQTSFPCFCHTTSFDVASADFVLVEMNEIVTAYKNAGAILGNFYSLVFSLASRYFKIDPEELSNSVRSTFKEYVIKENETIQALKKVIFMDEVANATATEVGLINLERGGLEYRKHGISTVLASQKPTHFVRKRLNGTEVNLLASANYHIALTPPKADDVEVMKGVYEITPTVEKAFQSIELREDVGQTFYLYINSKSFTKIHLFPVNKLGTKFLWTTSSKPEDRTVREATIKVAESQSEAINALAYYYGGSASKTILSTIDRISNDPTLSEEVQKEKIRQIYQEKALEAVEAYRNYKRQDRSWKRLAQAEKKLAQFAQLVYDEQSQKYVKIA